MEIHNWALVHTIRGIPCSYDVPIIWQQMAWEDDGTAFWRLSYSSRCLVKYWMDGKNLPQDGVYALNQHIMLFISLPGFTVWGIKGWKWEWHLTMTSSDPLVKFFFCPPTLDSIGLSSNGKSASTSNTTMIPLNWKSRLPSGHVGLLVPVNQQANIKKGGGCGLYRSV